MRSISANFTKAQIHNPSCGAYLCLTAVVKNRKFSRKSLVKAFNELMPEDEYLRGEAKCLIDYLEYLTNLPEEGEI